MGNIKVIRWESTPFHLNNNKFVKLFPINTNSLVKMAFNILMSQRIDVQLTCVLKIKEMT